MKRMKISAELVPAGRPRRESVCLCQPRPCLFLASDGFQQNPRRSWLVDASLESLPPPARGLLPRVSCTRSPSLCACLGAHILLFLQGHQSPRTMTSLELDSIRKDPISEQSHIDRSQEHVSSRDSIQPRTVAKGLPRRAHAFSSEWSQAKVWESLLGLGMS